MSITRFRTTLYQDSSRDTIRSTGKTGGIWVWELRLFHIGGQRRWGNTAHLGQYTQWIANGKLPESSTEVLDVRGQLGETVMLGLRLAEGVSLAELQARFGISVWEIWEEELNVLLRQGLVELVQGRLRLTARGLLLANQVQSAFVGSS